MKKTFALILILALVFCMAMPTFAVNTNPPVAGETVVGIQVYDYDPDNLAGSVSFTVPLYVTLAVTKDGLDKSKIVVPAANAYNITNTAAMNGSSIAVTKLVATKITASEWDLVTDAVPTAKNQLHMSIGAGDNKIDLLAAPTTYETTTGFIHAATNAAAVKANAQIAAQGTLPLDIAATILTTAKYDKKAAAPQFNLAYTLQPLDKDGKLVTAKNASYVGDIKALAGY